MKLHEEFANTAFEHKFCLTAQRILEIQDCTDSREAKGEYYQKQLT